MQSTDWFILISTFVAGCFVGIFIYMTGFRDIDFTPQKPSEQIEYEIIVSQYGGCERGGGCPSYRLVDGGYTFIPSAGGSPISGSLEAETEVRIQEALAASDLAAQAETIERESCDSWIDLNDTSYNIAVSGERFELDTCHTDTDVDDELIEELDELFEYFLSEQRS